MPKAQHNTRSTLRWYNVVPASAKVRTEQRARNVHPGLVESWAPVCDAGPTLSQHYGSASGVYWEPSGHKTLNQCCFNGGPPSTTLDHR